MIELGCSTLGHRFDPLEVALAEIKQVGFRRIDVAMYPSYCPHFNPATSTEAEQDALCATVADLGLSVAAINGTDGLLGKPADWQRAMDYARACLRMAKKLGAYGVTMQSGVEPAPGQWLDVAKTIAPDLRELGTSAADLGLELTLELHKSMVMANSQEALDLMALVDHPQVGVALDPSHIVYAGEEPAVVARRLGSHVKHVHLRDAIGKNILVVPGDGTVDFGALARALTDIGYQRTASIELEYENARAPEVRPDLARAKAVLEKDFAIE